MGPSILVDDANLVTNYNYLGGQWSLQTGDSSVLNGTVTTGTPQAGGQVVVIPTQLFFSFWGSGISFYGNMTSGVAANYTIDGTTRRPVPFPSNVSNGKTGINLFSLDNLTEGLFHDINIYPAAGQFVLDYITYVPNSDTALTAVDLILDDADSALQYGSGQWNHTTGDFQQGRPYNGTMTGTNTKGATMQLTFVGSSITVNGLLNRVDGRLSASFVVDGQKSSASNVTFFDGNQEDTDSSRWMLSQQFFHQDLTPGQHTLVATLEDVSGPQMLWIDSVVFEGTSSTTLSSAGGTGSGSSLNLPTAGSTSPSFPKAGIAGIAAGAFLLSLVFLGYARRARARRTSAIAISTEYTATTYVPPPPPPPPPPAPVPVILVSESNVYNTYNPYAPATTQYVPPPSAPPPPPSPPQQQYQYRDQPPLPPTALPTAELTGSDASYYAASSSADTPSARRGDSYYTYGSKAELIGLEWGTNESHLDGAASVPMPVPLPARGDGSDPSRAAAQVGDGRNPPLSNHAHEDGRDDGEAPGAVPAEPRRERDAGPAAFPPAYDDRLYGR